MMVVVNVESKVPVRDVRVSTDNGQEMHTSWDGCFALPDSFQRLGYQEQWDALEKGRQP